MVGQAWRDKVMKAGAALAGAAILFFAGRSTGSNPSTEAPIGIQPIASIPPTDAAPDLKVHVVGRVAKPGLYTLPGGSRIQDAIDSAGGSMKDADLDSLNLAQKLTDGDQIRVGAKGDVPVKLDGLPEGPYGLSGPVSSGVRSGTGAPASTRSSSSGSTKSARPAAKSISLNNASAAELDRLPGVGPSTAAKIIDYRRQHGGFSSVDELLAVRGIGPKKLADIKPFVRL